MNRECPCCGGDRILSGVKVSDRGEGNASYDLRLETYKRPDAMIFKNPVTATIKANVCEDCGFILLFADPGEVKNLKLGNNLSSTS